MAATGLPELTKQWLRQVAQPYADQSRTYADVEAALVTFPTLRPKTDVYTFNDGRTQLLICVHGLLPISYRQSSYNIPVAFWIPHPFPREPPMAYVVPTSDMFVRPSKTVDPSGQCDVEYLRNWQRKSEGCDLVALINVLRDQFSREPPLYSKPRDASVPAASTAPPAAASSNTYAARPPPPLPNTQSAPVTASSSPVPVPIPGDRPILPAKPGFHSPSPSVSASPGPSTRITGQTYDARPPPPPPPTVSAPPPTATASPPAPPPVPRPPHVEHNARPVSAYGSIAQQQDPRSYAPPRPPHPPGPSHTPSRSVDGRFGTPNSGHLPFYSPQGPAPQQAAPSGSWPGTQGLTSPPPPQWQQTPPPPMYTTRPASVHDPAFQAPPPPPPQHPQPAPQPALPTIASIPPPAAAPARSLMDEDDGPTPGAGPSSFAVPAPPRPPNPEIIRLHAAVHAKLHSELAALSVAAASDGQRLRATQEDLLQGEPAIRDEMARLEAVRDVCRTVAGRLREVVERAEHNVGELRRKGDPEVDELVCSTSIVHNQLINLVAEDNAIEDTMYHLHRALNAGRIDLDKFLKTTRALAEEQFTKRVLIERIASGLQGGESSAASWT